jgi:histone deacetylase 6
VTGTLKAVKSDMDPELSGWYKQNSRVYVGSDHACWADQDLNRKVNKRRFGNVIRSHKPGLNRMVHAHAEEVQNWMLDRTTKESGDTTEDDEHPSRSLVP